MKVVDSGVVIDFLLGGLDPRVLESEGMAVPHLIDSEVTHVLRRLVQRGDLTEARGQLAVATFVEISLVRWSVSDLRLRMWELRDNVTGYDATYVALAEWLRVPLLTTDRRLARAPGLRCPVEIV